MFKVKVSVCSEARTQHITQYEHHVEFLNMKPDGRQNIRLALKGSTASQRKEL